MMREEAINQLKDFIILHRGQHGWDVSTLNALDMAIKALETKDVLDKIRAEIEEYKSTIDNAISEDELKIKGMKEAYENCLEIIDKYKTESEYNEDIPMEYFESGGI